MTKIRSKENIMKTAIVKIDDLSIESIYEGSANQAAYGGPWASSLQYEHVEFDETVEGEQVIAQDNAGTTEVVMDVQPNRNNKLIILRNDVKSCLSEADIAIMLHNDADVNKVGTLTAWKSYRISLRNLTDTYKDGSDSKVGTSALDAFTNDMSDFTYPTKPS